MQHATETPSHSPADARRIITAIDVTSQYVPDHVLSALPELEHPLREIREIVQTMDELLRRRAEEFAEKSEVVHT